MPTKTAPALAALLDHLIDYAGMFPPAALALDKSVANFSEYQRGNYSWMLRWLVIGEADANRVPDSLSGKLSLLADKDNNRAAALETKAVLIAHRPVYCEVAVNKLDELDAVKQAGCFAKIRAGGVKPEAIPSTDEVASFILACADRRLAFKATAGLHHPIRAEHALTYEKDAPRAVMHGFLNVLIASAFAWQGDREIEPILREMNASAFSFDDSAHWRDKSITTEQIREARLNFMHSIGSCSFEEPVQELQTLGLL